MKGSGWWWGGEKTGVPGENPPTTSSRKCFIPQPEHSSHDPHSNRHRLVGLVVKTSASRAKDPGFESRLRWLGLFRVESDEWPLKMALQWLPCQDSTLIISLAGPSRPVNTLIKTMTHTQAYIHSRLTVSREHTRKQLFPNKTSPHPHPKISTSVRRGLPPVTSNLLPPPPPSPLFPQPLPS